MGLDFDGAEAHWAYSGFNRFREKLASDCGFSLRDMDGFKNPVINPNGKELPWTNQGGDLQDFLHHSDCDGKLTPKQIKKICPALEKAIKNWENDEFDTQQALLLIDGMKDCIAKNKPLIFC